LLRPRLAVSRDGKVRVPAAHGAEGEARALLVAGRDAARPVQRPERDRLLAGAAASPGRGIAHRPGQPYGIGSLRSRRGWETIPGARPAARPRSGRATRRSR